MLKSFSVGHTAKGKIWWQAWEVDGGEAHKGTVDTIEAALAAIGVTPTATPAAPRPPGATAQQWGAGWRDKRSRDELRLPRLRAPSADRALGQRDAHGEPMAHDVARFGS